MTPEEVIARRAYIRQLLKNTPYCNKSNEVLDNIRLVELNNTQYLYEDEEGNDFYIGSSVMTKEETEFRKCRSMIPFEFLGVKGKDFNWNLYEQDVDNCKTIVNDFICEFEIYREMGVGLYIYSETMGSGKTMLACCILNELSERYPISTKFVNSLDLLEMTKQTFKGSGQDELKALYDATVLVIDDIGVQMSKEWVNAVFYRLINSRHYNKLVTIYTSNVRSNNLKMDGRTISRIDELTYLLSLPEKSIRREKSSEVKKELMEKIREKKALK